MNEATDDTSIIPRRHSLLGRHQRRRDVLRDPISTRQSAALGGATHRNSFRLHSAKRPSLESPLLRPSPPSYCQTIRAIIQLCTKHMFPSPSSQRSKRKNCCEVDREEDYHKYATPLRGLGHRFYYAGRIKTRTARQVFDGTSRGSLEGRLAQTSSGRSRCFPYQRNNIFNLLSKLDKQVCEGPVRLRRIEIPLNTKRLAKDLAGHCYEY